MTRIRLAWLLVPIVLANCASHAVVPESREVPPPPEDGVVHIQQGSRQFIDVAPVATAKSASLIAAPAHVDFQDGAVSQLSAPLDGRVVAVHVQVGQGVRAGDPLVTLDCPDAAQIRASLESATATLREARAALDRQTRMMTEGVGIERDRIAAETHVSEAEAEVARIDAVTQFVGTGNGTQLVIRAPMGGTVINRTATVGLAVQKGGDPLMEIGNPSSLWIVTDVFERDLPMLREGALVMLTFPSLERPLEGHVTSIGAVVASGLRTSPVRVSVAPGVARLRPGMYGRAELQANNSDITVPTDAVLIKDGRESVVYVQQDDLTFVRRQVSVGVHVGDRIQITSGLAPGDKVVIKGALLLDGASDQLL